MCGTSKYDYILKRDVWRGCIFLKNIVSVCRKQEMGRKLADIHYGQKQIQPPEKCKYLQRKSFRVNFGWAG